MKEEGGVWHGCRLRRARHFLDGHTFPGALHSRAGSRALALGFNPRRRVGGPWQRLLGGDVLAVILRGALTGSSGQERMPLLQPLVMQLLLGSVKLEGKVRRRLRLFLKLGV